MTLGPLMVDVAGLELTPEDRDVLRHPLVGSVILFTRNYASSEQLARLVADIHCGAHPGADRRRRPGRRSRPALPAGVLAIAAAAAHRPRLRPRRQAGPDAGALHGLAHGRRAARAWRRPVVRALRRSRLRRERGHRRPRLSFETRGRGAARAGLRAGHEGRRHGGHRQAFPRARRGDRRFAQVAAGR